MAKSDWRALRKRAGLSIRELEARTGINRGRLSIIERGVPATDAESGRLLAVLRPDHPGAQPWSS